ncbi:FUSC family protein [Gluconacetobacter dulcium]|uniref:Uncharacterized protein n=3 Tax=Gluconacetobacter TaxID=89583 RepID=A0ABR6FAG0_9PROT|nr:FUSC family protein [Gluconacetobacter dulcium]MBB2194399.1 hypothetical protein [Gluconacetobacter dulcium]
MTTGFRLHPQMISHHDRTTSGQGRREIKGSNGGQGRGIRISGRSSAFPKSSAAVQSQPARKVRMNHILPFNLASFSASFRATILSGLRRIGRSDGQSDEPAWVGKIVQGMGVLITNGARENSSMTDIWLHHAFSIMTVGRNLLYVRMIFLNESLPEEARTMVSGLFRILLKRDVPSAALLATADQVLSGLREMERRAQSAPDRLQLTALIGCLMIVTTELRQQNVFFGPTRMMPFGMAG